MKKLYYFLLFSTCFSCVAIANEVSYFNKSWEEIKTKAKTEGKYIFIDCYTDWCGWCKVMDKETMKDEEIITLINEKFVAVKMDMEHGEGAKFAMKYHITGYPTFIFFNPQGEIVYKSVGYQKPKDFMGELKNALDKSKQFSAPGFSAVIDIDFPPFYKMAFAENGKRKFPEMSEVSAFLDKQSDLFSEINWGIISRFDLNEKYTKFFFDNIKKYEQLYGSENTDDKVNSILMKKEQSAVKDQSNTEFNELLQIADKYVKDPMTTKLNLRLDYYKDVKDWNRFMGAFSDFIKIHKYDNPDYINSLCWNMYENCTDKKLLAKACVYMGNAVAKEPKYANMDTYAAILYKSGQLNESKKWANKAILEGKKEKEDTSPTEELLKKIKAATRFNENSNKK